MEVDSGLYYVPEGLKQTIHLGRLLDEVIAFVRRYRYMYIRYLYTLPALPPSSVVSRARRQN